MNKVVICIPTYKRPEMLEKLVLSIVDCKINKSVVSDVSIVIVDNDSKKTAESTVNRLITRYGANHKIDYFSYPVKGLSNVRNELLKKALELKPDYIAFIDDDEYADPEWIDELVKSILKTNGDVVRGPVVSKFKDEVPEYVTCWFNRPNYRDDSNISRIASNNLIIKVKSLLKYDVWFDPRFNKTGGEDSFFGLQMLKKGAKIYWASDAIVYETVPDNRANIKWISKRYYSGANRYAFILRVEKNYKKIIKKMFVSFLYIFLGSCALILTPFHFKKRYWGVLKLYEGCGGITGFLSLRYNAYK